MFLRTQGGISLKRLCCLILVTLLMLCSAAGSETLQLIPADPVTLPAEAAELLESPELPQPESNEAVITADINKPAH